MNGFTVLTINFQRTYGLSKEYESIKERAKETLVKYLEYPSLIVFNDSETSVTFSSERLIPVTRKNMPRIMLLFSNPHPHSIHQGMFLSPNTRGRENLFWPVMEDAGWLPIPKVNRTPKKLVDICLEAKYSGPFELLFYCYYAFPTDFPEDIIKIFGKEYFEQIIEPESRDEFYKTLENIGVDTVVAFNKGIFNLVSKNPINRYIERLNNGEVIHSQIKCLDKEVPIFLTYPTGWRYHKHYMQLRKSSLNAIKLEILGENNILQRGYK